MRVLMTGGGTAGHINPALAIASIIKQNNPGAVIEFVGTAHGKEKDLVPREGYRLHFVEIQGVRRSLSPANLATAWYIMTAPGKAAKLIRRFDPDIVIGTGGYVCWPTLKAASKLGIPTMVHESNALPGLAVRKLQRQVDRILINFQQTRESLSVPDERVIRVGNPLRGGFGRISPQSAKNKLGIDKFKYFVMSVGGSLGAEVLNENALKFMIECADSHPEILYMHAAGVRYYPGMGEKLRGTGLDSSPNVILCDYIHDMPLRMAAADVVISRSGAMTLSELALMKKAALLIPSPNVVDNHQYKNARVLADAGAALLLEESEMLGNNRFSELILELLASPARRDELGERIGDFADSDANKLVYAEILKLLSQSAAK